MLGYLGRGRGGRSGLLRGLGNESCRLMIDDVYIGYGVMIFGWFFLIVFMEVLAVVVVSCSRGTDMYTNYPYILSSSMSLNSSNQPWAPLAMYYAKGTPNAIYNTPFPDSYTYRP